MVRKRAAFLVDARWLGQHRRDKNVILVDTRPADEYWSGHPSGARHFDPFPFHYYDTSERGTAEFRGQLTWIFSALGATGKETVVFYENESGMRATRGAWALQWLGHPRVRILDGGLRAAPAEKLTAKPPSFAPSRFVAKPVDEVGASAAYVVDRLGRADVQIFDVRSDAEYFSERIRARRGGAIPGAVHEDWTAANSESGRFQRPDQLRERYLKLGLSPDAEIIPYCQGGYRAAHAYFALKLAGFPRVRNYWGSWAEWGNRDDLPIEHPVRST